MPANKVAPLKVLITDDPHPIAAKIFEEVGFHAIEVKKLSAGELAARIGDFDALVVRSSDVKDASIFQNAKKLRVIGRAGTGFDNINRELASRHNIVVMNAPDGNAPAAAELTMGHMLNLARNITIANAKMHSGEWSRSPHKDDFQLRGKTLGIIGCGRIGSRVATYSKSFGMNVIAYDPYVSEVKVESLGGKRVATLDELLVSSDIVTLHPDLNGETRKIINRDTLKRCKRGVCILNCARGSMVDAEALAEAIRDGHVAGAALDVIEDEPLKSGPDKWRANPLLDLGRVTMTPHLGGTTKESLEDVAKQVALQIVDYLCNGVVANAVNAV